MLVVRDRRPKCKWAHLLPEQGVGHPYHHRGAERLGLLGYRKVILKSDQGKSPEALGQASEKSLDWRNHFGKQPGKRLSTERCGGTRCAITPRTHKEVERSVGVCNGRDRGRAVAQSLVDHRARGEAPELVPTRSTPRL